LSIYDDIRAVYALHAPDAPVPDDAWIDRVRGQRGLEEFLDWLLWCSTHTDEPDPERPVPEGLKRKLALPVTLLEYRGQEDYQE
jgi:hypothetical protein